MTEPNRCGWSGADAFYNHYHDTEWGVPEYDDQALFAKLILDGAQAGLSWITILRKRDNYYKAFDNFDPDIIALYDEAKVEALMQDTGIVRNRLKINAAIKNARGYQQIRAEHGSFSTYLWRFVGGKPIQNSWTTRAEVPTETEESRAMSKALKKYGFSFVGPTIVYAFMQATGLVNDHLVTCFRHDECRAMARSVL